MFDREKLYDLGTKFILLGVCFGLALLFARFQHDMPTMWMAIVGFGTAVLTGCGLYFIGNEIQMAEEKLSITDKISHMDD